MSQRKAFKQRELIKHVEANGFERLPKRGNRDHVLLALPDERRTTVPGSGKKTVGTGLTKAILRKAGLDDT